MAPANVDIFEGKLKDGSPSYVPTIPELQGHVLGYVDGPRPKSTSFIGKRVEACLDNRYIGFLEGKYFVCIDYLLGYYASMPEAEYILYNAMPIALAGVVGASGNKYVVMSVMPPVLYSCRKWNMYKGCADMRKLAFAVDETVGDKALDREVYSLIKTITVGLGVVSLMAPSVYTLLRNGEIVQIACRFLLWAGFAKLFDIVNYFSCVNSVRNELDVYRESQNLKGALFEAEAKVVATEKRMENIRLLPKPSLASKDIVIEHFERVNKFNEEIKARNTVLVHRNKHLKNKAKDMETSVRLGKQHAEEMTASVQRLNKLRDSEKESLTDLECSLAVAEAARNREQTNRSAETARCTSLIKEHVKHLEIIDGLREEGLKKDEELKRCKRAALQEKSDVEAELRVTYGRLAHVTQNARQLYDSNLGARQQIEELQVQIRELGKIAAQEKREGKLCLDMVAIHQKVGHEGVAVLRSVASAAQTDGAVHYLRELERLKKDAVSEKLDMSRFVKGLARQSKEMDKHLHDTAMAVRNAESAGAKKDATIAELEGQIALAAREKSDLVANLQKEISGLRGNHCTELLRLELKMTEEHALWVNAARSENLKQSDKIANLENQIAALRSELTVEKSNNTPAAFEVDVSESPVMDDSSSQGGTAEDMGWSDVESDGEEAANGRAEA